MKGIDWTSVIADAVARIDWVQSQTNDPAQYERLLPMAGAGNAVADPAPVADPIRRERRKAFNRERMARVLGHRKGNVWAGREEGIPVGTFDPAAVSAELWTAALWIIARYVDRHSGPMERYPLSPEGREDAVSRIVYHVWTRDYSDAGIGAGNVAAAVWQACSAFRRSAWQFDSGKSARRSKRNEDATPEYRERSCQGSGADNPARIAIAIEEAARGLWAPSVQNRQRKKARRNRGGKRMNRVTETVARECLTGNG